MHLEHLDLNLLVALNELMLERSVTRAAGKLCVSQPAMSGALMRLRRHFGDALIQRVGREMVLTPFAMALAPRVRDIVEGLGEVVRSRPGFDPANSQRTFVVVGSDYAQSVFMPTAYQRIMSLAPGVCIDTELRALDHEERIDRGLIDVFIAPRSLVSPEHPCRLLFEDEYVAVVWSGNQEVGKHFSKDQFLNMGHAVRSIYPGRASRVGDELRVQELGYQRKVVLRVPTFEMLPRVIVGTRLVATMQRRLAMAAARTLPIRIFEHPLEMRRLELVMQWPRHREEDSGGQWLRQHFLDVAREEFAGGGGITVTNTTDLSK